MANAFGQVADGIFGQNPDQLAISAAWLGVIAYTLQIYFDFSGYSDMAIGLGCVFGFHFPENFNYPYIAASVKDFWRQVAYFPKFLVPRLSVYSVGRKPWFQRQAYP